MSFKKSKRDSIRNYILRAISKDDKNFIKKTRANFNISYTTVLRYIKQMEDANIIRKESQSVYSLVSKQYIFDFDFTKNMFSEDYVYSEFIKDIFTEFNENVIRIWMYAFTEMFNNIIDHSDCKLAKCIIRTNFLETTIYLIDDGVGIFNKIKEYFGYDTIEDAIIELFKGKLTTDSKRHSGEGIFFTSKIMDTFIMISSNRIFSYTCGKEEYATDSDGVFKETLIDKGTTIVMSLSNNSNKKLKDVFDMFATAESGLSKTIIPVKMVFEDGFPVSRSQAKRLVSRFEMFEKVVLDFDGVDEIGQGFAHELFAVFLREHENVDLDIKNANEDIVKMIKHVSA